jgi:hypothetical protein
MFYINNKEHTSKLLFEDKDSLREFVPMGNGDREKRLPANIRVDLR